MKCYRVGTASGAPIALCDEHLNQHVFVTGAIGSGKSRWLWNLLREHRRNRRGFCLIDPGDLAADFLADIAREVYRTGNPALWKKIHYLRLSPFGQARFDPMTFRPSKPIHPELLPTVFRAWQAVKARSMAEVFQSGTQGDSSFEGMPRLERWLMNVLIAVSTWVDGKRMAVGDACILLDLGHPDHMKVYERIRGKLPREVRQDFEFLHQEKIRPQDVLLQTESTLNRLRSYLGPCMQQMLGDPSLPTFELREAMQNGDYVIVDISPNPYSSMAQGVALARLVVHQVIETALTMPRDRRRPFSLICDEVQEYATPDLPRAMRVCRKHLLGFVLGAPGLRGLRRKDHDLAADILDVAQTVVAFRSKWPEDNELLARFLHAGDIDFTPHEEEHYEHHGEYDWIEVVQTSEGLTETASYSVADSVQQSRSRTVTRSETSGTQHGTNATWNESAGTSDTGGRTTGEGRDARNQLSSRNASAQESRSQSRSEARGGSENHATSHATTEGESEGATAGRSQTATRGGALGKSTGVSRRPQAMPRLVRVLRRGPALRMSVADQIEQFRQFLAGQGRREATVKTPGSPRAIRIEAVEVPDPFRSAEAHVKAVEDAIRRIMAAHDYYFVPDDEPGGEAATDEAGDVLPSVERLPDCPFDV